MATSVCVGAGDGTTGAGAVLGIGGSEPVCGIIGVAMPVGKVGATDGAGAGGGVGAGAVDGPGVGDVVEVAVDGAGGAGAAGAVVVEAGAPIPAELITFFACSRARISSGVSPRPRNGLRGMVSVFIAGTAGVPGGTGVVAAVDGAAAGPFDVLDVGAVGCDAGTLAGAGVVAGTGSVVLGAVGAGIEPAVFAIAGTAAGTVTGLTALSAASASSRPPRSNSGVLINAKRGARSG